MPTPQPSPAGGGLFFPSPAAGFLDEHLLSWLPAWSVAVAVADPRWGEVAGLTLELVASHRASLPGEVRAVPLGAPVALDADLGVHDVAELLVRPARSGWLLGRTALLRACAVAGVAGGLGDRAHVLGTALRGAAAVGRLEVLVAALVASVDHADRALAALSTAMPVLGPAAAPWRLHLTHTLSVLDDIRCASGWRR